jgi:hypothetical protein
MNLFQILDSIIDTDQAKETLADVNQIISYAEHGSDMDISLDEAQRIQRAGCHWLHEMDNGNGEWCRIRREVEAMLERDQCGTKYYVRRPGHTYWSVHSDLAEAQEECRWANRMVQPGHRIYQEETEEE